MIIIIIIQKSNQLSCSVFCFNSFDSLIFPKENPKKKRSHSENSSDNDK